MASWRQSSTASGDRVASFSERRVPRLEVHLPIPDPNISNLVTRERLVVVILADVQ
jgi:hypothetical protein